MEEMMQIIYIVALRCVLFLAIKLYHNWPIIVSVALLTGVLTYFSLPLLRQYALARPNARSSHKTPIAQGGGMIVIALWFIAVLGINYFYPHYNFMYDVSGEPNVLYTTWVFGLPLCVVAMAILGAYDDIRPLSARFRLIIQATIIAAAIFSHPSEYQIFGDIPQWLERAICVFLGLWFVNLYNFMDGIDGITVTQTVSMLLWLLIMRTDRLLFDAILLGTLLGFYWFNRPPARLFLGDSGSLAIALIMGLLLFDLIASPMGDNATSLFAALLLPLYYIMDATTTLLWRLWRREKVWLAHREHAYQRAFDAGWSANKINLHILGLNMILGFLASLQYTSYSPQISPTNPMYYAAFIIGVALTAGLLYRFRNVKAKASKAE